MTSPPVVLVSGASSGIGRAIAEQLAAAGYRVYGASRRASADSAGAVHPLTMYVDSDRSVSGAVDSLLKAEQRLDIVVNSAGNALAGSIEETSLDEARAHLETNFFGTARVIRACLPELRGRRAGHIVMIGSLAGRLAPPFEGYYAAAKSTLEGYAEALYQELWGFGIHVNLVEPGFVRSNLSTSMSRAVHQLPDYAGARQRAEDHLRRSIDQGIDPTQVAGAVLRIVRKPTRRLRVPVGSDAVWLPRLKQVTPEGVFLAVTRRKFGVHDPEGRST